MTFEQRIARYIASEHLLSPGAKVIVGLSGGADSAALLAVLTVLGYECIAGHCHFGLRDEEADRDLEHSAALAAQLGCKFCHVKFNAKQYMAEHGISAEMACRELRYDYFEKLRTEEDAEAIAVGHHYEDNIETFFLNLLRGSGLHGLRGMLPANGKIIRPLLEASRSEIEAFLSSRNIGYVIDSTNLDNDFKRNKLRNRILPLLEAEFPGATEAIGRSIANLRGNEQLYNTLLPPRRDSLEDVTPTLLHEWLAPMGFNSDQCRQMLNAAPGAQFYSSAYRLTLCSNRYYVIDKLNSGVKKPHLTGRIIKRQPNLLPKKGVIYLDADKVPENSRWKLRTWQPGDRMRPFGMKGSKLVADLLAEAGIAASRRRESFVLTLNNEIIWAVDVRASALYPITDKTVNIIEITHETRNSD